VALVPAPKKALDFATSGRGGKTMDFTRETDFQVLLPDITEIDVNDPDNDHLLYLISKRGVGGENEVFRLPGNEFGAIFTAEDGHYFSNYVRYKETPRMKLLQLRCIKPYLFNSPIPINEAVIKASEVYKAIFTKELHETMGRIGNEKEDSAAAAAASSKLTTGMVSVNTAKVTSFLQRVRSSQTAQSRKKKKKNFVTSSVVIETQYVELESIEFIDLLERRRALRPKVITRAPLSVQIDKCDLLVQVVGAKNIPLRTEHDGMAAGTAAGARPGGTRRRGRSNSGAAAGAAADGDDPIVADHMLDERKLKDKRRARTFVEVKFQEHTVATLALDGGTPMWRESLSLPFRAPQDDFSPANLEQIREEVYFTLFDEVEEDDSERGG
jgi:coiled-coil and C2 domain-containing protein 2A